MINLIYPRRCPVCDEVIHRQGYCICYECKDRLVKVREPICKKCGKMLEDDTIEYCFDCQRKPKNYIEGRAVYVYDSLMKESIARFKYKGKKEYAEFYSNAIVENLGDYIKKRNIELIIPVPIHRDKLKVRGFNQADVIARNIGEKLGIKVESNALVRIINTKPQKELNNIERSMNLSNAFKINSSNIKYKKSIENVNNILIIDDIYTTGATVDSCAKVINKLKYKNIYFVTISIGHGK